MGRPSVNERSAVDAVGRAVAASELDTRNEAGGAIYDAWLAQQNARTQRIVKDFRASLQRARIDIAAEMIRAGVPSDGA
jgi:hypothetical protein